MFCIEGMESSIRRNVLTCCKQYQLSVNYLLRERCKAGIIEKLCDGRVPPEFYSRASPVLELVGAYFKTNDINVGRPTERRTRC